MKIQLFEKFKIMNIPQNVQNAIKKASNANDEELALINNLISSYLNSNEGSLYKNIGVSNIVQSIIQYNSLDPRINEFIYIIDALGNDIKNLNKGDAFQILEWFKKDNSLNKNIYREAIFPGSGFVQKGNDYTYLLSILNAFADKNFTNKYKKTIRDEKGNTVVETPTLKIIKDNKGKGPLLPTEKIKIILNEFISEEDDENMISLSNWVDKLKWDSKSLKQNLLKILTSDKVKIPEIIKDNKERVNYWKKIIDNFWDKNNKEYDLSRLGDYTEVDPLWDPNKNQNEIAQAIQKYIDDKINKGIFKNQNLKDKKQETLKSYLISNKIDLNIPSILKYLKQLIDINVKDESLKKYLSSSINNFKNNNNKLNSLINQEIPPNSKSKAQGIIKLIQDFLKSQAKISKTSYTIKEAIKQLGKSIPEAERILQSKILEISDSYTRNQYLDKFNKIWRDKTLKRGMLNTSITLGKDGKFRWQDAIKNYLNNINIE